jgi:hypothetical protein
MAVTYTLGKDATISGISGCVRDVTASIEASRIDVTCRGDDKRKFKSGLREATIEVEVLDEPPAAGDEITISHANSGLGGIFIVTSVARSEPLDDVVSYKISCKYKEPGGP